MKEWKETFTFWFKIYLKAKEQADLNPTDSNLRFLKECEEHLDNFVETGSAYN